MADGIGLGVNWFEAETEKAADAALARALETHGDVLLAGERLGRKWVGDLEGFARLRHT